MTANERHARRQANRCQRPARRRHGDAGHATVLFVVIATALLACAGLVIDGGRILTTQETVDDQAEHAARAGAAALDLAALRSDGRIRPDPRRAVTAARTYLTQAGLTGRVTVTPAGVTVEIRQRVQTSLLALAGARSVTVVGRATARPITIGALEAREFGDSEGRSGMNRRAGGD